MKKFLCIALFSVAVMANANNEVTGENTNDAILSNFKEIKELKIDFERVFVISDLPTSCSEQGNTYYNQLMATGNYTHREARSKRRSFVRECRDYFWQFGFGPNTEISEN